MVEDAGRRYSRCEEVFEALTGYPKNDSGGEKRRSKNWAVSLAGIGLGRGARSPLPGHVGTWPTRRPAGFFAYPERIAGVTIMIIVALCPPAKRKARSIKLEYGYINPRIDRSINTGGSAVAER
ncbi:hypothetical protein KM043_008916 [Ampulex compressa]|nr:hypothetical protein KM043_008916 [Ampulex compressa]